MCRHCKYKERPLTREIRVGDRVSWQPGNRGGWMHGTLLTLDKISGIVEIHKLSNGPTDAIMTDYINNLRHANGSCYRCYRSHALQGE